MALSVIFVDSVTAMEQHLAIIVNAMMRIIHVLWEWTQYVELKKHAQALVIKFLIINSLQARIGRELLYACTLQNLDLVTF